MLISGCWSATKSTHEPPWNKDDAAIRKTRSASRENVAGGLEMLWRMAIPSIIHTLSAGTELRGKPLLSRRASILALFVFARDPSPVAKASGRDPSEYYKTFCMSIPRLSATTISLANLALSPRRGLFFSEFFLATSIVENVDRF